MAEKSYLIAIDQANAAWIGWTEKEYAKQKADGLTTTDVEEVRKDQEEWG